MEKYASLVEGIDSLVSGLPPTPTPEQKQSVYSAYHDLLQQYPLLTQHWKKLTSLTYQFDGLANSLEVMKNALDIVSNCPELWTDYLGILMGLVTADKNGSSEELTINGDNVDEGFVRGEFERAVDAVGGVFMNYDVWEKYISWEKQMGKDDNFKVVQVLFRVIHLPLYDYSKAHTTFDKEWKSLSIEQLQRLTGWELKSVDEFKLKFDTIFQSTQGYVAEIWAFESIIKQRSYTIEWNENLESDSVTWEKYITHQVMRFKNSTDPEIKGLTKGQIITTFEQALIPMASVNKFWYSYLSLHLDVFDKGSRDLEVIDSIFSRACNMFLPLSNYGIRLSWAMFKEAHFEKHQGDRIEEIYLSVVKSNFTETKPLIEYVKYLSRKNSYKEAVTMLTKLIDAYIKKTDPNTLSINEKRLLDSLNDKLIGVLITEEVKLQWQFLYDYARAREEITKYLNLEELKSCISFWFQSYKFYKSTFFDSSSVNTKKRKHDSSEQTTPSFTNLLTILKKTLTSFIPLSYKQIMLKDFSEFALCHQSPHVSIIDQLGFNPLLSYDAVLRQLGIVKESDIKTLGKDFMYPGFQNHEKPEIVNYNLDELARWDSIAPLPAFRNVGKATAKIEPLVEEGEYEI